MEIRTGWLGERIDLVSGKTGYRIGGEDKKRQKRLKMDIATRSIGRDDGVWAVEGNGWRGGKKEEKKEEQAGGCWVCGWAERSHLEHSLFALSTGHSRQQVPAGQKTVSFIQMSSGQWERPPTFAGRVPGGWSGSRAAASAAGHDALIKLQLLAAFSAQDGSCTGFVSEHFVKLLLKVPVVIKKLVCLCWFSSSCMCCMRHSVASLQAAALSSVTVGWSHVTGIPSQYIPFYWDGIWLSGQCGWGWGRPYPSCCGKLETK